MAMPLVAPMLGRTDRVEHEWRTIAPGAFPALATRDVLAPK
jgi:hypothetical protein